MFARPLPFFARKFPKTQLAFLGKTLTQVREKKTLSFNEDSPRNVCVVGSGPGGFYGADALLKWHPNVRVDMMERFPVPYGLVRTGVAPDHPEVKNVTNRFEGVTENDRFRFIGNMTVGEDVSVEELKQHYDAIVFAYGTSSDRQLGIPGEDLRNVASARSFVNWYNGHPDFTDFTVDLSGEAAIIIGNGNVAMDVARMLLKPIDELKGTDITDYAAEALSKSHIKDVFVVGRRGPVQAAYATAELREIAGVTGVQCFEDAELSLTEADRKEIGERRALKRKMEALFKIKEEHASRSYASKRLHFRYLLSPEQVNGSAKVALPKSVSFVRNRMEGDAGSQRAVPTGETVELQGDLVLRSIGYKSEPIDGIPFDSKRSVVRERLGRLEDENTDGHVAGLYAAGWLKRGPVGIIGTNILDSQRKETARSVIEDGFNGVLPKAPGQGWDTLKEVISQKKVLTTLEDWRKLDAEEIRRGKEKGKIREKFVSVEAMLAFLGK